MVVTPQLKDVDQSLSALGSGVGLQPHVGNIVLLATDSTHDQQLCNLYT
jgi:hypothetical protein